MPAKKGTAIPDDLTNIQYNMVIVEMADGKSLHNNVLRAVQSAVVAVQSGYKDAITSSVPGFGLRPRTGALLLMSGGLVELKAGWEEVQASVEGVRAIPLTVCLPGTVSQPSFLSAPPHLPLRPHPEPWNYGVGCGSGSLNASLPVIPSCFPVWRLLLQVHGEPRDQQEGDAIPGVLRTLHPAQLGCLMWIACTFLAVYLFTFPPCFHSHCASQLPRFVTVDVDCSYRGHVPVEVSGWLLGMWLAVCGASRGGGGAARGWGLWDECCTG